MAVNFDAIEQRFREIFEFIQQDLSRIIRVEPGVNYAAAAVIACACEAIAKYRSGSGKGADAFAMLLPEGNYQPAAKTLYEALRNGLVHGYTAHDIEFNGSRVELDIAWRETPHLSVEDKGGKPHLTLNVHELCRRLSELIDRYRAELQAKADARDRFLRQDKRKRIETVHSPDEVRAWKALIYGHG
jgi:hypothetical protein